MTEPLSCPFCGYVAAYHKTFVDARDWGWVGCCQCGAQSGHGPRAKAIAEWNARADANKIPFDGLWWMDLLCAVANARYALEQWRREYEVAARFHPELSAHKLLRGCVHRGQRECETLREMEETIRSVVSPASVDRSPKGEKPQALNAKHESAVPERQTPNDQGASQEAAK